MKSNPRNKPSMPSDSSGDDGASVMFSLEALVAKAEGASTETGKNVSDDSGLIDLRAIEASAQNTETTAAPLVPIFPFGAPEPIQAAGANPSQTTAQPEQANGKSRKGRLIAASLVAVAISAVAIGVASAGPKVEPMTLGGGFSPVFQDVAKRALKAIPAPVEATAKENSAQTNAKEPLATSKVPARQGRVVVNPQPRKEPTKVEPPKPPPPAEQCDLMCQMRRRAGK